MTLVWNTREPARCSCFMQATHQHKLAAAPPDPVEAVVFFALDWGSSSTGWLAGRSISHLQ